MKTIESNLDTKLELNTENAGSNGITSMRLETLRRSLQHTKHYVDIYSKPGADSKHRNYYESRYNTLKIEIKRREEGGARLPIKSSAVPKVHEEYKGSPAAAARKWYDRIRSGEVTFHEVAKIEDVRYFSLTNAVMRIDKELDKSKS